MEQLDVDIFGSYVDVSSTALRPILERRRAMVEAVTAATDAVANLDWATAVSNVVEGWNSVAEEPRIVIPRKVKLECRKVWLKRSEGQYRQRVAQSHSRIAMYAEKVARRRYARKAR